MVNWVARNKGQRGYLCHCEEKPYWHAQHTMKTRLETVAGRLWHSPSNAQAQSGVVTKKISWLTPRSAGLNLVPSQ